MVLDDRNHNHQEVNWGATPSINFYFIYYYFYKKLPTVLLDRICKENERSASRECRAFLQVRSDGWWHDLRCSNPLRLGLTQDINGDHPVKQPDILPVNTGEPVNFEPRRHLFTIGLSRMETGSRHLGELVVTMEHSTTWTTENYYC